MDKKTFFRFGVSLVFRARIFARKNLRLFSKNIRNKKILELGSGSKHKGRDIYSMIDLFDSSNEFIQSDIVEEYGHKIVDATKMRYKNEFDVILCLNVLEHVYDFNSAIKNCYGALKTNGVLVIFVPGFYPLHSEPDDYWRFTEHSFRKLLKDFKELKIKHYGIREYPFGYYIEARK